MFSNLDMRDAFILAEVFSHVFHLQAHLNDSELGGDFRIATSPAAGVSEPRGIAMCKTGFRNPAQG